MVGVRRWSGAALLALLAIMAASGCTFSAGTSGEDRAPQVVTATLPDDVATLAAAQAAVTGPLATGALADTPTAAPVLALLPSATLPPSVPPPSATAVPALAATQPATVAAALAAPGAASATPDYDASVVAALTGTVGALTRTASAWTATPSQTPPPTHTATQTATQTPPPSSTPLPTPIPSPVPTRTLPGPTSVPPLDDGSGNPIPGTGNDSVLNPVPGVTALPQTLYYLSDVGNQAQVFRLRIGLNHPDQLTYSTSGVSAYSVAPDGTLAYVDGNGDLVIGGVPVPAYANPDGTRSLISTPLWSPNGTWLAYTVSRPSSGDEPPTAGPQDGVHLRSRDGRDVLLSANRFAGETVEQYFSGIMDWHPTGNELVASVMTGAGHTAARLDITASTASVIAALEPAEIVPGWSVRWNTNGTALIATREGTILQVDVNGAVTSLVGDRITLDVVEARQWADGTLLFSARGEGDAVRLYRLTPGTSTPQAITDVLAVNGRVEFLLDSTGQPILVTVHESLDARFGTAYYRAADGALLELTVLTGPVAAPQWGPVFKLRDWARVRALDGEALNVRAQPSLQGEVLIRLVDATRVAVIGGPRVVDGYRWWQVRTPDGVAGWAVDSILDARGLQSRTLLPVD